MLENNVLLRMCVCELNEQNQEQILKHFWKKTQKIVHILYLCTFVEL